MAGNTGTATDAGRELGVGVIGCGNISTTYFEMGALFRGYRILACADIQPEAAQAQAAAYSIDALGIEELLQRPDIDIVVNLTIPDVHVAVSTQILNAGKHVYSEKPLALGLAEGLELKRLADSRNLRVGCAPDTFFGGAHQLARQLVDDGAVGRITSGTCHVLSHGMESWHPNPDFFFKPGAGPILDLGPYYIANLINLIGPVKRVGALSSMATDTRIIGNGDRMDEVIPVTTPTNIHALLEFENNSTFTLSASWDVWAHEHNHMELYGMEGTLFVPDPNFFHGAVKVAGVDREIREVPALVHPFNVLNQEHEDGDRANYRGAGLADMALALQEGREHRCSLERTLHAVDVMVSILQSGEDGRFVDVTTTCTRPDPVSSDTAAQLLRAV